MSDWAGDPKNASTGEFVRDTNYISDRISSSVTEATVLDNGSTLWPFEAGRYRLIAARACPWAHRAVIVRRLMGLDNAISLGLAGPTHDVRSWRFDLDPDGVDPVLKIPRLQDAFLARFPDYSRGITVPSLVDVPSGRILTNDYRALVRDFITQGENLKPDNTPDLYPAALAAEIDEVNDYIFDTINNGVYRCGFAGEQSAYEEAYHQMWEALDWAEERLGHQRYLVGNHLTVADIRLWVTLIRFDPVYYSHFKCSRNKIAEMPHLRGFTQELFQLPGFGDTTDFTEIKQHYFIVHKEINPSQVVPVGPDMAWVAGPHDRDRFGGSPFPQGTYSPAPVLPGEEVKNPEPFQTVAA